MKMKKETLFGLALFVFLILLPVAGRAQSKAGLTVGLLDNSSLRYSDGCGSPQVWPRGRARYGQEGYFYMLPSNDGNGAAMNLNGSVVRVRESGTNRPGRLRRGTKFYEKYAGAGYSVRVDYTVVRNVEHEDGFSTTYTVTITVKKGKLSKTVTAVSESGC